MQIVPSNIMPRINDIGKAKPYAVPWLSCLLAIRMACQQYGVRSSANFEPLWRAQQLGQVAQTWDGTGPLGRMTVAF